MGARATLAAGEALPPPPWKLRGEALVALRLVPEHIARAWVPADSPIFCPALTRTAALLYVARYHDSPVGEYHELIVAPAIVRREGGLAFWISHIVVDSESSARAGRSLWALPKVLGSFEGLRWEAKSTGLGLRIPFMGTAASRLDRRSLTFKVRGSGIVCATRVAIELPDRLELRALGFHGTRRMYRVRHARLTICAPKDDAGTLSE